MKIGDKVMYSRAFCRSVGLYASNDPPRPPLEGRQDHRPTG